MNDILGWGVQESFFKSNRWTSYVTRAGVIVGLCGHKHKSIETAQECAALMLTSIQQTGHGRADD